MVDPNDTVTINMFSEEEMSGHRKPDAKLEAFIQRIESLLEERKELNTDIKDVYAEAKAVGYCPKIMKHMIRLRAMKPEDRREMEDLLDTYREALCM